MSGQTNGIERVAVVNRYDNWKMHLKGLVERYLPSIAQEWFVRLEFSLADRHAVKPNQRFIDAMMAEKETPLFSFIEIETINRCNNTCAFCPVNKNDDPRAFRLMDKELFESIIRQLAELNYSGYVALFSNNEPLLDKRIYDFARFAREQLPNAYIYMYTNGSALNAERLRRILDNIDSLMINNYNDELRINPNIAELIEHVEAEEPHYAGRFVVRLRKKTEMLHSRAGNSPNRRQPPRLRSKCNLPFVQMVVRPDGKTSLCCNDALGQETLGDLTKQTLLEAWRGPAYQKIRALMAQGREHLNLCRGCDSISTPDVDARMLEPMRRKLES